MTRYGMVIDVTRCSGCYNCQIACKDEHCGYDYPGYTASQPLTGHFWMKLIETERGQYPKVKLSYTAIPCMHCEEAPCIKEAKNGAVYRRADGIVIIDPVKAKGQKHLVDSCPYGVIYWNKERELPQKCTFCAHLLDDGWKEPRCVEICPAGALRFGDLDDPESEVSRLVASGKTGALHSECKLGENVRYIGLPEKFIAGTVAYADTDECAAGVRITLSRPGDKQKMETITDNFGDFEFEGLLEDTEYIVDIQSSEYAPRTLSVRTQKDVYLGVLMLEKRA
jgi:Fe-S-cluster-containing dehydrogenase component